MELTRSRFEEDEKQVQLGMPGAWAVNSSEQSDHYTTKIGGSPDWPASLPHALLRSGELLKCAICGGFLGLVAQVHAPLALQQGTQLTERTIYILGCPAPGCGVDPACWRTIRVQKEPTVKTISGEPDTAGTNCPLEISGKDSDSWSSGGVVEPSADWWDDNNVWGAETQDGDINAAQPVNEFMSMQELEAALMEAGRLAAESAHEESSSSAWNGVGRISKGEGGGLAISDKSTDMEPQNLNFRLPVLPCFYVYFQAESNSQERTSTLSSSSSSSLTSSSPGEAKQVTSANPVEQRENHGGDVWEGEEYEPDRALHVDRTYLRFKKHLDQYPEQCLRYCFGGEVLWAIEERAKEAPENCAACGGPRVYEMQLMPPLLYFLQQAANQDSAPRPYSSNEWDWFTLIVFTCAQSCSQKASDEFADHGEKDKRDWSILEEATILQQEVTKICSFD